MSMIRASLTLAILVIVGRLSTEVHADYITPVSATGTGVFTGNASLIIDGFTPSRGTIAPASTNVVWNSLNTFFTIDFGSIQTVANLTVAIDNNDNYLIQSSTDGTNFKNLFTFLASDGPVTPSQGGLDLLSTNPLFPSTVTYPGDSTTPVYVGRGFDPTAARYLRISALVGDSVYAIGEVDAFTASVPEPSSILLCGIVGVLGGIMPRVRRQFLER